MLKRIFLIILSFILSFIFAITSIRDASAYVPVIDRGTAVRTVVQSPWWRC